jgi:hypothetical protein
MNNNQGFIKTASSMKGAITLAFLTLIISACEERRVVEPLQSPVTNQVETAEPIDETPQVTAQPTAQPTTAPAAPAPEAGLPNADLLGENITVSTKVQTVLAPNVFTVYDKESLRGQVVLVVSQQQAPEVGTNIELTGVVRNFVLVDVNREYGLNISPDLVTNYVNKPYIAAAAIEKVD